MCDKCGCTVSVPKSYRVRVVGPRGLILRSLVVCKGCYSKRPKQQPILYKKACG